MALCMVFVMSAVGFAEETTTTSAYLDDNKKGSITVNILSADTGKAIPGGTVTLYKVASVIQVNGDIIFQLTEDFEESGVSVAEISETAPGAKELSSVLETYANNKKISGKAVTVDKNGQAFWDDLNLGLYLIINTTAAEGYEPLNTFLITVPRYLDGCYVYDVNANPKQGTAGSAVSKPSKPDVPTGKLPQTGQFWWPVPLFAIMGILFVMFGWYRQRRFGEENNEYE